MRRINFSVLSLIVFGLVNATASAGGLYKWTDENGEVHYTDVPPPDAPPTEEVYNPYKCESTDCRVKEFSNQLDARLRTLEQRGRQANADRYREFVQLANNGDIAMGMPQDLVLHAWGKPARRNRTLSGSGYDEQWVYRKGSKSAYVHIENGVVTYISF